MKDWTLMTRLASLLLLLGQCFGALSLPPGKPLVTFTKQLSDFKMGICSYDSDNHSPAGACTAGACTAGVTIKWSLLPYSCVMQLTALNVPLVPFATEGPAAGLDTEQPISLTSLTFSW